MAATAAALTTLGHDVRVACPASFGQFVRNTGFEPMECDEIAVDLPVMSQAARRDNETRLLWAVTESWPSDSRPWIDSLLRQAEQWIPEVVMVEPVEHAGRIVAARMGLPLVVHGWGFTLPATVEQDATASIMDMYERHSAQPSPPTLIADLGPADVQAADVGAAQRYRYRPFAVPGKPVPPPRTGRARVLVTLGTYANPDAAQLIRVAVDAVLQHDVEVITVLGNRDRGTIDTFPRAVVALDWVDMTAAASACDVIVHHGGAGTSWTTLSAGRPAVVLPQAGDQFRNATIISAAGAGVACSSRSLRYLADTVGDVLERSDLRERAENIAGENAAMPDEYALAETIATLGR
jgi:hypothetical protein